MLQSLQIMSFRYNEVSNSYIGLPHIVHYGGQLVLSYGDWRLQRLRSCQCNRHREQGQKGVALLAHSQVGINSNWLYAAYNPIYFVRTKSGIIIFMPGLQNNLEMFIQF